MKDKVDIDQDRSEKDRRRAERETDAMIAKALATLRGEHDDRVKSIKNELLGNRLPTTPEELLLVDLDAPCAVHILYFPNSYVLRGTAKHEVPD